MEYLAIGTTALAVLLATACFFLFSAREKASRRAAALELQLAASGTALEEAPRLRDQLEKLQKASAIAETRASEFEKQLKEASARQILLETDKAQLLTTLHDRETQVKLANQRVIEVEKRMQDQEKIQKEFSEMAKASLFEHGKTLNKELLDTHKRETEEVKKYSQEISKHSSEGFLNLIQTTAAIKEQLTQTKNQSDIIYKALSEPSGVGKISEIGLENTLKHIGLQPNIDYEMQCTIKSGEGGLRPDAIVKLPQDRLLVIDSKASKIILEIAEAITEEKESEAFLRLKVSMNKHLNGLIQKSYKSEIQKMYEETGNKGKISKVIMVMYVATESALDKIVRADPEFTEKCHKNDIVLVAPASLYGLLSVFSQEISLLRQSENHEKIIQEVGVLMQHCIKAIEHADKIGNGIQQSMKNYTAFARSVNRGILSKMRSLNSIGITLNKPFPANLKTLEVLDPSIIIEGEVEMHEDSKVELLPRSRMADA